VCLYVCMCVCVCVCVCSRLHIFLVFLLPIFLMMKKAGGREVEWKGSTSQGPSVKVASKCSVVAKKKLLFQNIIIEKMQEAMCVCVTVTPCVYFSLCIFSLCVSVYVFVFEMRE